MCLDPPNQWAQILKLRAGFMEPLVVLTLRNSLLSCRPRSHGAYIGWQRQRFCSKAFAGPGAGRWWWVLWHWHFTWYSTWYRCWSWSTIPEISNAAWRLHWYPCFWARIIFWEWFMIPGCSCPLLNINMLLLLFIVFPCQVSASQWRWSDWNVVTTNIRDIFVYIYPLRLLDLGLLWGRFVPLEFHQV